MRSAKLRPNVALKMAIFSKHKSQLAFAKKIGLDPGLLSAYIQGRRRPTAHHRLVLAKALGKSVERLFSAFRPRRKVKTIAERVRIAAVRMAVFDREAGICRCCATREPESMHELRPRSLGGEISTSNSIAVCGHGTAGCHALLQKREIAVEDFAGLDAPLSALRPLKFTPRTDAARDWLSGGTIRPVDVENVIEVDSAHG